ncbi:MAG: phosphoribosylanthranilate isomerase [Candidatus Omnitrophica bacterium]|nr:phosphoribosylanthranilate isomerase [Candidatus Omnitrophota bacterium]
MVRVKICGFTARKDIENALALGIKIIGVNFYAGSPRHVPQAKAKDLLAGLPEGITVIGVFVDPDEKNLLETVSALNLSGVQLHGEESKAFIEKVREKLPGKIIIKSIRVKDSGMLSRSMETYTPDFFLLDSYNKKSKGGTGKVIDYSLLNGITLPWNRIFLAGGITPCNAAEVLKKFKPYGIDVASGVEVSPGKKDRKKMRLLIENIKNG